MSLSLSELLNPAPKARPPSPGAADEDVKRAYHDSSNVTHASCDLLNSEQSSADAQEERQTSQTSFDQLVVAPTLRLLSVTANSDIRATMTSRDGGSPESTNAELDENGLDGQPAMVEAPVQDSLESVDQNDVAIMSERATVSLDRDGSVPADGREHRGDEANGQARIRAETETDASPSTAAKPRPKSRSTTKDEGMHSDRRYLCYLCDKLFTRRRSVRDHISKIHNLKTWDPTKSLEIIVDPATGEPVEPLETQIANAGQIRAPISHSSPPPQKPIAQRKIEASAVDSRASSVDQSAAPAPAPVVSKKRPAPGSTKKGMARIKAMSTPNKKAKLSESDSIAGSTPVRSPSATPVSQIKKAATKLKQSSASIASRSPTPSSRSRSTSIAPSEVGADTPGSNDDGEVYCICRKGDNHSWMIACDGGCEEWYHGKCVNIRERDGDLIDKYICPRCQREAYQTTWKRMCRRTSCRKPARVLDVPPSKYCSPECGRKFFVEMILKSDPHAVASNNGQYVIDGPRERKLRKKMKRLELSSGMEAKTAINAHVNGISSRDDSPVLDARVEFEEKSEYETDSSADDDDLPNRGAALRAGEVKAIIERRKTIDAWRELGTKPTSAPTNTSGDPIKMEVEVQGEGMKAPIDFTAFESQKLVLLGSLMATCRERVSILTAREQFLDLVKTRSQAIIDDVRKADKKNKDPCGFDPRLSWTEGEFLRWRSSPEGASAFASQRIGPPGSSPGEADGHDPEGDGDGAADSDQSEDLLPTKGGVCIKSRCQRHRAWQKAQLAEIRFEQDLVHRQIERLEREEAGITDRAVLRSWEQCPQ